MKSLLSDKQILDLSSGICGSYCTKLLADAGAEVIKIEPASGDELRQRSFFHFLNTSKKSVVLDLESEAGRQDFLALVSGADMVLESYQASYLDGLGLTPQAIRAQNRQVVLVSISAWGRGGPYEDYPANEFTLQSWVGAIAYKGIPGQAPYGVAGNLGDFMTASNAAAAGLAALISAEKTGQGSYLDISQYESMTTSFITYHHILEAFDPGGSHMSGRSIEIPSIEPTSDGWVGFCTITGQQFQDFCVLIEDPEMGEDERFINFDKRMDNREEAWERIARYTSRHTTSEIVEKASLLRIPVAPIGTGETVLACDHFLDRDIYVENPAGFSQPRVPYLMKKNKPRDFEPAPSLGEHTQEVLDRVRAQEKTAASADETKTAPPAEQAKTSIQPEKKARVSQVLEGVRVCDISAFWAGPLAAEFMASLGAEVIKVESPKRPDGMRFAGSVGQEKPWEWSPVFHGSNCNKKAITLDILSEEGMGLLKKLISSSDLVIENYSPRVMENWGLSWEVIQELNPRAIMLRMPAFGLTGPWRDRTGFAMTIEQASGLAYRTGDLDGRPMVPRGVCDPLGAMHSVFAALLALKHREMTGEAQLIEVPLVEVGLNAASEQVVEWSANKNLLQRMGNRSEHIVPQGVYPCQDPDSWVCISMDRDSLWTDLVNLIDSKELRENSHLLDLSARKLTNNRIDEEISNWTRTQNADSAAEALAALGIPAAPVVTGRQSFSHPQLAARKFHQWLEHPVAGRVPYPSFPIKFDGEYLEFKNPAPLLGQHTEEVLSEILGLAESEISELEKKGIIGKEPNFG